MVLPETKPKGDLMKKHKKLALNRETLACIGTERLPRIAGGDTFSFDSLCLSLCITWCRPPIVVYG